MIRRRARFADLVERQLDVFAAGHVGLLRDCDAALRAYRAAPGGEAEERYGSYVDLVDEAREALEELRDAYAETLDEAAADAYRAAFNRQARKRYPELTLELE
jgi:uncharacterized protein YukE